MQAAEITDPDDHPFRLHALANVRPLRPVRLLVAGRDQRYVRAMAFLLGRRGYDARAGLTANSLFRDVEEHKPEVVVLVEADSFGDTLGLAVQVLGLSDGVSVVVATNRADAPPANRLRFVEKWASFDVLVEAVERAWAELPPAGVR
jgi:DNA-binding NtrC family response regulator